MLGNGAERRFRVAGFSAIFPSLSLEGISTLVKCSLSPFLWKITYRFDMTEGPRCQDIGDAATAVDPSVPQSC